MTWNPFDKKEEKPVSAEEKPAEKTEKTPAELIADALRPVMEGQARLDARLDGIEQNTRKAEPRQEPTEVASVLENEDLAFAQRIGPVVLRQLEMEARVVRGEVKAEYTAAGYGEVWAEFEKEINSTLDASPVVGADSKPIRGNPDYIRNVVDMVFGRAARKAGIKFGGREKGFFLESAGGGDSSVESGAAKDGLTEGQRRVFQRMGVPLAEGAKTAAKLKFIN